MIELVYKIVGIGEILWDVFPDGKKLGGAPANFAYFAKNLGQEALTASRVGDDSSGKEILNSLKALKLSRDFIQIDPGHQTGAVEVRIDSDGQPDYIIRQSVAWDFLKLTEKWKELAFNSDLICFGTLAQRFTQSRKTIIDFLRLSKKSAIKVLDINLRQNFYSREIIIHSLELCTILKLNEKELEMLKEILIIPGRKDDAGFCRTLMGKYDIKLICITRGVKGSILIDKNDYYKHPGYRVKVADTVGAGDAFTAAVAVKYIEGGNLKEISDIANRLGSWVCSQAGPTPPFTEEIKEFL